MIVKLISNYCHIFENKGIWELQLLKFEEWLLHYSITIYLIEILLLVSQNKTFDEVTSSSRKFYSGIHVFWCF